MSKTVLVTGLLEGVTADDLSQFLSKAGKIDEITFLEGDSRALIAFQKNSEAVAAVDQLSGRPFKGSTILVELHKDKPKDPQKEADPKTKGDSKAEVVSELFALIKDLPADSQADLFAKLKTGVPLSKHAEGKEPEVKTDVPISKNAEIKELEVKPKKTVSASLPLSGLSHAVSSNVQNPVTYLRVDTPRLPMFSGDKPSKGDASYSQWRFEVCGLKGDSSWSSSMVMQSIRKSCKGLAQTLLHSLGLHVTIDQVLLKFDDAFGNVHTGEDLLREFYSAQQKDSESVVEWECRLEDIIHQIKQKEGMSNLNETDMLRHQFWSGICSSYIKSGTRHLFDSGATYSKLVRQARSLEDEEKLAQNKKNTKSVQQQSTVVESEETKLDKILKELKDLKLRMADLEKNQEQPQLQKRTCYECGSEDHLRNKCPNLPRKNKNGTKKTGGSTSGKKHSGNE